MHKPSPTEIPQLLWLTQQYLICLVPSRFGGLNPANTRTHQPDLPTFNHTLHQIESSPNPGHHHDVSLFKFEQRNYVIKHI